MPTESNLISTSPTPGLGSVNGAISERKYSLDSGSNGGAGKLATMTYDPTPYIQRARVTRPAPPKPSTNPMQFVQIKPCNLYQSAQEQLKKAEEVKKVKEIKKEEPEDWQSNLDNWKSSRRKRVEHIIDRVVEVKKLELEEHDRMRRKSKTFSEMMEERSSRRSKLASLTVYKEDEPNDFSDLGIGTSSASGKSSLSEDCDNHSVMSDNADTDKPAPDSDSHLNHENGISNRDFISSPGYDTSSSTAPSTDSPDPCEYTYEGAIQDYKIRISRAQSNTSRNSISSPNLKDSSTEHPIRPMGSSKIESRLMNFEMKSPNEQNTNEMILPKKDLPKVDVLKRREQFEKDNSVSLDSSNNQRRLSGDFTNAKRLSNRLSGDITSLKDRLQNLEKQTSVVGKNSKIDVHVTPLKDRLSSLQNATAKEEVVKKPILLVDEHQLEMLKKEELEKQNALRREVLESDNLSSSQEILNLQDESNMDTDREDSGIHTTDVSCSVSQTDEQPDLVSEEPHHPLINAEDGLCQNIERQKSNIDEKSKDSTTKKHHPSPDTITNSSSVEQKTITTTKTLQSKTEDGMNTPEPVASIDQDVSVEEALELALRAIDNENLEQKEKNGKENDEQQGRKRENEGKSKNCEHTIVKVKSKEQQLLYNCSEPIYENLNDRIGSSKDSSLFLNNRTSSNANEKQQNNDVNKEEEEEEEEEEYYQVPKISEPYYEVPKYQKPVPVYENIEIFYSGSIITAAAANGQNDDNYQLNNCIPIMEPPKEKPPPPPLEEIQLTPTKQKQQHKTHSQSSSNNEESPSKRSVNRMNSTKRIKKELRNKRSNFLGIEGGNDDEISLELTVAPPPDMAQLLQEERRLEKQLYIKAGLYESSDTGDSRDSGVSENHSRQSSEPFTNSSEEHEDLLMKKEKEIIEVLEKEEKKRKSENWISENEENDAKIQCIEDQIREQEEVLRVERELLQLEQEELKRQRENLILRENLARRELEHGAKMLMSANRLSLQDINNASTTDHYANIPNQIYQVESDYRKSMSDLPDFNQKRIPPAPPVKPLRSHLCVDNRTNAGMIKPVGPPRIQHSQSTDDFAPLRNYQPGSTVYHGNMTRHTLHALSATPKPKYTDGWVQAKKSPEKTDDSWLQYKQKRKSTPEGFNYNKHWLIQEAEQRRIDQQRGLRNGSLSGWNNTSSNPIQKTNSTDNKPLPDAVIQTLTQRVQSKGLGERKRLDPPAQTDSLLITVPTPPSLSQTLNSLNLNPTLPEGPAQDKILSVSGKKKCSYCGEELGRGAAMIIESLRLFYHMNCFKCCVCHVQLGDGLNGTDVRVRNHKLHCHNCYSNDDGIKFSCV